MCDKKFFELANLNWGSITPDFKKLSKKYDFIIYDMYYGKAVDREHLKIIKKELI